MCTRSQRPKRRRATTSRCSPSGSTDRSADERVNGVRVVRTAPDGPAIPFDLDHLVAWVMSLEHAMTRRGLRLVDDWTPEVIHAHDWLVAHAAATLKAAFDVPLVATIHATEAGQAPGLAARCPLPRDPHRRVVADLRVQPGHHLQRPHAPRGGGAVRPAGRTGRGDPQRHRPAPVDRVGRRPRPPSAPCGSSPTPRWWSSPAGWSGRRASTPSSTPPPGSRCEFPGLRIVVAGRGAQAAALADRVARDRLAPTVTFAGFLPEDELVALVAAADAVVVPSLYEPFGLVALEATALGTPTVVADTGRPGRDRGRRRHRAHVRAVERRRAG